MRAARQRGRAGIAHKAAELACVRAIDCQGTRMRLLHRSDARDAPDCTDSMPSVEVDRRERAGLAQCVKRNLLSTRSLAIPSR